MTKKPKILKSSEHWLVTDVKRFSIFLGFVFVVWFFGFGIYFAICGNDSKCL